MECRGQLCFIHCQFSLFIKEYNTFKPSRRTFFLVLLLPRSTTTRTTTMADTKPRVLITRPLITPLTDAKLKHFCSKFEVGLLWCFPSVFQSIWSFSHSFSFHLFQVVMGESDKWIERERLLTLVENTDVLISHSKDGINKEVPFPQLLLLVHFSLHTPFCHANSCCSWILSLWFWCANKVSYISSLRVPSNSRLFATLGRATSL